MQGNAQVTKVLPSVEPYQKWAFDEFITYSALGGLIISDNGTIERMPIYQFCARVNVDQKTTWRWKHSEGFAAKVRARREEIMPLARESMMWNRLFSLAMQNGDKRAAVDATKTWLGHFGELKLPTVKQEVKVELNTWADLVQAKHDVIEGEVVDEPAAD